MARDFYKNWRQFFWRARRSNLPLLHQGSCWPSRNTRKEYTKTIFFTLLTKNVIVLTHESVSRPLWLFVHNMCDVFDSGLKILTSCKMGFFTWKAQMPIKIFSVLLSLYSMLCFCLKNILWKYVYNIPGENMTFCNFSNGLKILSRSVLAIAGSTFYQIRLRP